MRLSRTAPCTLAPLTFVLACVWLSMTQHFSKPQAADYHTRIIRAHASFIQRERSQSTTVEQAVRAYAQRYRRRPPPGFEAWAQLALQHNATLIDEYDQLEADLLPFRRAQLSRQAWQQRIASTLEQAKKAGEDLYRTPSLLQVRSHQLDVRGPLDGPMSAPTVEGIIAPAKHILPDIRVLFSYLATGRVSSANEEAGNDVTLLDYTRKESFDFLRQLCQPGRRDNDICTADWSATLHGFFQSPMYFRPTDRLVPIISRAKISSMTDILAANPCYAHKDYRQWGHEDKVGWDDKKDAVFWRGASTGVHLHSSDRWRYGHRQRFVTRANELNRLSGHTTYNASFTKLVNCDGAACKAFTDEFPITPRVSPTEGYGYKIDADIDGEGMSCRFYRQLSSNSLPLKQTVWIEWHQGRIVPWLHYVPLSLQMDELPHLTDWLLHDKQGKQDARFIAEQGAAWAARSLRHIDITLHYARLLIELASIL